MEARYLPADELGIFALMADALALKPIGHDPFDRSNRSDTNVVGRGDAPVRRGLFERIDHWLWLRSQRSLEAHLAKARDVYDLEARIRDIERGAIYRYY